MSKIKREPLLFSYQSVHYILRPKQVLISEGISIPINTPCEVQIRTLLQHAHAELTHDAIYKSKKTIKPIVHRTVAKCMALIETTDDFFCDATNKLNSARALELKISEKLDSLYFSNVGLHPINQKSALVLYDTFESFLTEDLITNIEQLLREKPFLITKIKERYNVFSIYQQSYILFAYWLIVRKTRRAKMDWPLDTQILQYLATDLSISLDN